MTEEQLEKIMKEVITICEHSPFQPKGGQQVAVMPKGVRISHPDIGIVIFYGENRSMIANREAAISLFKTALILIK